MIVYILFFFLVSLHKSQNPDHQIKNLGHKPRNLKRRLSTSEETSMFRPSPSAALSRSSIRDSGQLSQDSTQNQSALLGPHQNTSTSQGWPTPTAPMSLSGAQGQTILTPPISSSRAQGQTYPPHQSRHMHRCRMSRRSKHRAVAQMPTKFDAHCKCKRHRRKKMSESLVHHDHCCRPE